MSDDSRGGFYAALYRFFRSLKLAVVLILVLTGLSIIATVIPQGRDHAFYAAEYPAFGNLWMVLGFNGMFTSFLFLLPTTLFFLNLVTCTVHRFITRWNTGAKRRFGPDILHIGLLVLLAGSLVTFIGRTEEIVQLRVGETTTVPGGYELTLDDFQFERYEDGSPKDWLSVVSVTQDGELVRNGVIIEVNSSLKLGNLKFYQSSYGLEEGIILADLNGDRYWLTSNNVIPLEDGRGLVLKGVLPLGDQSQNVALFDVWEGHDVVEEQTATSGDAVGQWVIAEVVYSSFTGLQMVHDPGYRTVLIALILLTIGVFLTYIQKIGDNQV